MLPMTSLSTGWGESEHELKYFFDQLQAASKKAKAPQTFCVVNLEKRVFGRSSFVCHARTDKPLLSNHAGSPGTFTQISHNTYIETIIFDLL